MPTSSARVEAWKSAWESRDPARVVALYTRDATHQSAFIAKIYPELGRLSLNGHHEIGVYARRGLERYTELRFEILTVTEAGDRAAVEYRRHSNLDTANPRARARTDRMARRTDQQRPRFSFCRLTPE